MVGGREFGAAIERRLRQVVGPLRNAIARLAQRAKVTRVRPATANRIQRLQLVGVAAKPRDADHAEPYGLATHPVPGAEAFAVALGGDDARLAAVVVGDPRFHPVALREGEVVLYSRFGQTVYLRDDGAIDVHAPGDILMEALGDMTLTAANITIEADEKLSLRGDRVYRHAATEDREDVAGRAEGMRFDVGSGKWQQRSWTEDADYLPAESNPVEPPEVDDP